MSDHGIRISTQNQDALTGNDKQLSYSSRFSTLKIAKRGYVSITTSGAGTGSKAVPHGLGYAPTFYVFRKDTASFSFLDGSSYSNTFHPVPGTSTPWINYHQTSDTYTDEVSLHIYIEGAASTTYNFIYYIFIDQGEYSGAEGPAGVQDYGVRVSKDGFSADDSKEQELSISSGYRTLKYYRELTTDYGGLTLPAINGDYFDQTPQEGTYIDFFHGLAFPPFFLAFSEDTSDSSRQPIPHALTSSIFGSADYALTSWCDRSRIRITFYRRAQYNSNPSLATTWTASTINIKLFIFSENLAYQ